MQNNVTEHDPVGDSSLSLTSLSESLFLSLFKTCSSQDWGLCDPMDCSLPGSSLHGIFQARILKWVAISFSRGSSWSRDGTRISCIGGRFFTTQLPGKSILKYEWKSLRHVWLFAAPWNSPGQNTGVDSLFLLQGIFPTQGLNPGLLHCRRILYQLSYQGSP